jgi:hypothetical protein
MQIIDSIIEIFIHDYINKTTPECVACNITNNKLPWPTISRFHSTLDEEEVVRTQTRTQTRTRRQMEGVAAAVEAEVVDT